jgi:hypothetical protein
LKATAKVAPMVTHRFLLSSLQAAPMSELYDRHPVELPDGQLGWEVCHRGICRRGLYLPRVVGELEIALDEAQNGSSDSSIHQPVPGVNL